MTGRVVLILYILLTAISFSTAKDTPSQKMRSGNIKILFSKFEVLLVKCTEILSNQAVLLESVNNVDEAVSSIELTDSYMREAILANAKVLKSVDAGLNKEAWSSLEKQINDMVLSWNNYENTMKKIKDKFKDDNKGIEKIDGAFETLKEWQQGYYKDKK